MSRQLYERFSEAIHEQKDVALITITRHTDITLLGATLLLEKDGTLYDEYQLPSELQSEIIKCSLPLLEVRRTKTIEIQYKETKVECFIEVFQAPPHLIVAGAGHVSEPVAEMGKMLGFYVTVIDDREQFANRERFPYVDKVVCAPYIDFFRHVPITSETYILLLTRGHQFDVVSLQELLRREEEMEPEERTKYIGMIGSRRRISGVFEQLKTEFTDHNFTNIYSPVGLDVGAQTPAEIAISILAEILKVKHTATGNSLKEKIFSYSQLKFRERVRK